MSQERLESHDLDGSIALFAVTTIIIAVIVCLGLLFWQIVLSVDYADAVVEREHAVIPIERANQLWTEVADPVPLTISPPIQEYLRGLVNPADKTIPRVPLVSDGQVAMLVESGIIEPSGYLTDESIENLTAIREGRAPDARPLPPEVNPEDPEFNRDAFTEFASNPRWWAWIWPTIALTLYLLELAGGRLIRDWNSLGKWLGIDRVEGAYVRRTLVALLYAPALVPVFVGVAAWRTPGYVRAWWKAMRNPYRVQIREAGRALAELRAVEAGAELIGVAEEQLELWRSRHDTETSKAVDDAAVAQRAERMRKARDTLLRLSAAAETEGKRPDPRIVRQRQTTGGS